MQNKRKEQGSGLSAYLKGVIWGCLWALICSLILLLLQAFGISHNIFSEKIMRGSVVVICIIGSFVGALVGISKGRRRIMPLSLCIGGAMFVIQMIMGLICFKETNFLNNWAIVLGADMAGAIAAAMVYRKNSNGNRQKIKKK